MLKKEGKKKEVKREKEMGNNIGGGRKRAKVIKMNGETLKLKTPIRAWDVVKDYPSHVLLDSEAVKHFGVRTKPLKPQQELKPRKIYFLLELPKFSEEKVTRRVRSGINMSAKDRLECLMLSQRSVSDLSVLGPSLGLVVSEPSGPSSGPLRVKVRLPRAQVAKLVEESRDNVEVAEKIIDLYMENGGGDGGSGILHREEQLRPSLGSIKKNHKAPEVRKSTQFFFSFPYSILSNRDKIFFCLFLFLFIKSKSYFRN